MRLNNSVFQWHFRMPEVFEEHKKIINANRLQYENSLKVYWHWSWAVNLCCVLLQGQWPSASSNFLQAKRTANNGQLSDNGKKKLPNYPRKYSQLWSDTMSRDSLSLLTWIKWGKAVSASGYESQCKDRHINYRKLARKGKGPTFLWLSKQMWVCKKW